MTDVEIESALPKLLDHIHEAVGLDFHGYRKGTLRRRLRRRLVACQCDSVDSYLRALRADPGELHRLIADLTIKYSYFFRDPHVFDTLGKEILPKVLSANPTPSVWSAGCAEGEELYSIAILLHELMGERFITDPLVLLGTDMDSRSLEKAKKASYRPESLQEVSSERMAKYFEPQSGHVIDPLRERVRFVEHNLTRGAVAGLFDLILLRNVLIYFERPLQQRVLGSCLECLKPGGFLVLGTGEAPSGPAAEVLVAVHEKERIYQFAPRDRTQP